MSLCNTSVECIKSVDLSKDCSSWHIKWTVGQTMDGDLGKHKYSPVFRIPPSDRFSDTSIRCNLSMWIPDDEACPPNIKLRTWNILFPIPMICRFAVSNDGLEMLLTNSNLVAIRSGDDDIQPVDIHGSLLLRKDNPVVHCWLDIPSAVIKMIEDNSWETPNCFENMPFNISNFLKRSEALYKSTMDPNQGFASHSVKLVILGKSNKRFYCHRDILAYASPIFATMFSTTQWKEGEDGTVEIDDIDEETMQAVLYHIYTGQFKEAKSDDLPNLIYAADKYQLNDLKSWAEIQLMADNCTDSERIDCLLFAERHQLHQLRAACIVMLSTNLRVLASDEIKEKLSKEMREELIKAVEKRHGNTTHISI